MQRIHVKYELECIRMIHLYIKMHTQIHSNLLIKLVEQYGVRKWSLIAQMLPGRIGKQCRERWHNHLRPDIKKDTWSEEEDRILIEAHAEIGNKWAEIAKRLRGRTENSIKNHWNATKRRQYSKRKCRSKYPRASLLQDYIKSLNLDLNPTRFQRKNNPTPKKNNTSKMKAQRDHPLCPNSNDDRPVPTFDDFKEDPDFCFDDNIFRDGCGIEYSLIDFVNEESKVTEMEMMGDSAVMEFEAKKEFDLVEMMSQINEAKM